MKKIIGVVAISSILAIGIGVLLKKQIEVRK